jgi:aerobic-type carbon monoxide dehydrogenase small subunit (CoxS/CutS family)
MSLPTRPLTVTINGRRYGPIDVPVGMMMIDVLHEMLDLTGSRLGCGLGICFGCVVIWDRDDQTSEEVPTCVADAHFFDGKRIRTIEGAAQRNDKGEIIARAADDAVQRLGAGDAAAVAMRRTGTSSSSISRR